MVGKLKAALFPDSVAFDECVRKTTGRMAFYEKLYRLGYYPELFVRSFQYFLGGDGSTEMAASLCNVSL